MKLLLFTLLFVLLFLSIGKGVCQPKRHIAKWHPLSPWPRSGIEQPGQLKIKESVHLQNINTSNPASKRFELTANPKKMLRQSVSKFWHFFDGIYYVTWYLKLFRRDQLKKHPVCLLLFSSNFFSSVLLKVWTISWSYSRVLSIIIILYKFFFCQYKPTFFPA